MDTLTNIEPQYRHKYLEFNCDCGNTWVGARVVYGNRWGSNWTCPRCIQKAYEARREAAVEEFVKLPITDQLKFIASALYDQDYELPTVTTSPKPLPSSSDG